MKKALSILPILLLGTSFMLGCRSVQHYPPGFSEITRHHVPAGSFQQVFDQITAAGHYRPVWIDGYRANGRNYFNAIFRPTDGVRWEARFGLNPTEYQSEFDRWTAQGFRPLHVESYRTAAYGVGHLDHDVALFREVRFAVIFVRQDGPAWGAYHDVSGAEHQTRFDSLIADGHRPRQLSVVSGLYTAFYEKADVGNFLARSTLYLPHQYQAEFDRNRSAGLKPTYLNAYDDHTGANSQISAIWTSRPAGSFVARHGLTSQDFQAEWERWTDRGYRTYAVTGYASGLKGLRRRVPLFAAVWLRPD